MSFFNEWWPHSGRTAGPVNQGRKIIGTYFLKGEPREPEFIHEKFLREGDKITEDMEEVNLWDK